MTKKIPRQIKEKLKKQVVFLTEHGRTPDEIYLNWVKNKEMFKDMPICYGFEFLSPKFFLTYAKNLDIEGIVFGDTAKDGSVLLYCIDRQGLKMVYSLLEANQESQFTTWQLIKNKWYSDN